MVETAEVVYTHDSDEADDVAEDLREDISVIWWSSDWSQERSGSCTGQLQAFPPPWALQVWLKPLFSLGWSRLFGAACLIISRPTGRRPWQGEMAFFRRFRASARQYGVVERIGSSVLTNASGQRPWRRARGEVIARSGGR